MFELCGHRLSPGEKRQVVLTVPLGGQGTFSKVVSADETVPGLNEPDSYKMPATLIAGAKEGKTVLITACIHAGEFPGFAAAIRAAGEIDPMGVCGNIIIVHCVNTSGVVSDHSREVPEDMYNLNGSYPGDENGGPGARIAAWFVKNVFPITDFILDMHSGSKSEPLHPIIFFPTCPEVREESLEAAKALNTEWLVESRATTGEYSWAANNMAIPGLLVERGYDDCCYPVWTEGHLASVRLLLKHLGVYDYEGSPAQRHILFRESVYLESDIDALWYPAVKVGQKIKKGDLLGIQEDFFGNELKRHYAVGDGSVYYYTRGLYSPAGCSLVAYGLEDSAEEL